MRAAALSLAALASVVTGALTGVAGGQEPPGNPCVERPEELLCPDLTMRRPYDLRLQRTPGHRALLRSRSSLDSVGAGPVEMSGHRIGPRAMRAYQRIRRRDGSTLIVPTRGRIEFYRALPHGVFWKLRAAARFELWTLGPGRRRIRIGDKLHYCLRDHRRTRPRRGSPRRPVYPACSRNPRRRRVILGTSVGWSDVYGPAYHEQYVDVTGLRGCFGLWHVADPENRIHESNESNNRARTVVRLPFRGRPGRCRRRA